MPKKSKQEALIDERKALEDDALAALGDLSAQRLWLYCPESIAASPTMSMKHQMHRCLRWSRKHSEAFDFGLWKQMFWQKPSNRKSMRESLNKFRLKEFAELEVIIARPTQGLIALQSQSLVPPKPLPKPIAKSLATAVALKKSSKKSKKLKTSSTSSSKTDCWFTMHMSSGVCGPDCTGIPEDLPWWADHRFRARPRLCSCKDLKPLTSAESADLYRNRYNVFGLNAAKRCRPSLGMQAASTVSHSDTRSPSIIVIDDDSDDVAKFYADLDADDNAFNFAGQAVAVTCTAASEAAAAAAAIADTASRSGIRAKVFSAHQVRRLDDQINLAAIDVG